MATVLIQEGTLREGDAFSAKTEYGRVRAMIDDKGRRVKEAGPSMPVEVIGFSSVPQAGSEFIGVEDEKKAKSISEYWVRKEREKELAASSKIALGAALPEDQGRRQGAQRDPQGRCPGFPRGPERGAQQALHRRDQAQDHPQLHGRHHRDGRHAGLGLRCHYSRLQGQARLPRRRDRREGRRRDQALRRHLQHDR